MLGKLSRKISQALQTPTAPAGDREHALQLATAALMVEMARADFDESDEEIAQAGALLEKHFSLSREETQDLMENARSSADGAISLHEFTRILHEHLQPAEKEQIIELLWRIAYADQQLDKYEDYLVRKIADLLYVSHVDFMRLKHKVMESLN